MPWLVVTGSGSWSRGGKRYEPGVHEVDDLTAEAARRAPVRFLVVSKTRPDIVRAPTSEGPLSMEDIKIGTGRGVQIVTEAGEVVDAPEPDPKDAYDYSCPYCSETFAHGGRLTRHIEFHHNVTSEPE